MKNISIALVGLFFWVLTIGLLIEPVTRSTENNLHRGLTNQDRAALNLLIETLR